MILLLELYPPSLQRQILSSHFFQLGGCHFRYERGGKQLQWGSWPRGQVIVSCLHAEGVNESFAGDFVI